MEETQNIQCNDKKLFGISDKYTYMIVALLIGLGIGHIIGSKE